MDTNKNNTKLYVSILLTAVLLVTVVILSKLSYDKDGELKQVSKSLSLAKYENEQLSENLSQSRSKEKTTEITRSDNEYRGIPEIGARYIIDDVTKNVTYVYLGNNSVGLSTKEKVDNADGDYQNRINCSNIFTITRGLSKDYSSVGDQNEGSQQIKKIGEVAFTFTKSQNFPCNSSADIATTSTATKKVFDNLELIP